MAGKGRSYDHPIATMSHTMALDSGRGRVRGDDGKWD